MVPGYHPEWMVGVRVKKNKKMIGFISAIPLHVYVEDTKMK